MSELKANLDNNKKKNVFVYKKNRMVALLAENSLRTLHSWDTYYLLFKMFYLFTKKIELSPVGGKQ